MDPAHYLPGPSRPAIRTLSLVGVMLGAFLACAGLLIAWIRTPEALYVTTDGPWTRVVRGGESFGAVIIWLSDALQPALWLLLAGLIGIRATTSRQDQT